MEAMVYIIALALGLFAIAFALGAARVAGDSDRQSDYIRRRFTKGHLPHRN